MFSEQQFVLDACRAAFSDFPLEVTAAPDPAYAVSLAIDLGVLGLVAQQVSSRPGAAPVWTAARYANTARNMMLVDELEQWCSILATTNLEPIVLKGPAMARSAFGSIGLRDSSDLDLILPFDRFTEGLEACVLGGAVPPPIIPPKHKLLVVPCSVPRSDDAYTLELHSGWLPIWGEVPERRIAPEDLETVQLGARRYLTLGPMLALLHASLHFVQHRFSLKTLVDVVATLRRARAVGVDEECLRRARQLRVQKPVMTAVRAADEFTTLGRAPSLRNALGEPEALTDPSVRRQTDVANFFEYYTAFRPHRVAAALLRGVWLSRDDLRHKTKEWVGPQHRLLRRALRPIRLAGRFGAALMRLHRPVTPQDIGSWRAQAQVDHAFRLAGSTRTKAGVIADPIIHNS